MNQLEILTLQASRKALDVRQTVNAGRKTPICVYDIAHDLGIEVRFVNGMPSLEGVYSKEPEPLILVSSLRPFGRQAFTCAHELGHHIFGHGDRIDEVLTQSELRDETNSEEYIAERFASFLLMPKSAVTLAFNLRGWRPEACLATEIYTVAGYFGVGYSSLIYHMRDSLDLLSWSQANRLLSFTPKQIRAQILGRAVREDIFVVDHHWTGRAIDIQVGDFILSPGQTTKDDKDCVQFVEQHRQNKLFRGVKPGVGRLYDPKSEWSAYVRVSRREYAGLSIFRHTEDPDYDAG